MFKPRALDFDGSADYLSRASDLTGNADSKTGIFSAWVRIDGGDGVAQYYLNNTSYRIFFARESDNKIIVRGRDDAGNPRLLIKTSNTYTASSTWLHILASWSLSTAAAHLYINDISDLAGGSTLDDVAIDYTRNAWGLGASYVGTLLINGAISEFYFAPGQYLDFSATANRRKFISAAGKPVPLGIDGSDPTGTAPLIYMDMYPTGTNRGTGGNFTENGSPQLVVGAGGSRKNNPALFD